MSALLRAPAKVSGAAKFVIGTDARTGAALSYPRQTSFRIYPDRR